MILFEPLVVDVRAPLARAHPLPKLAGAAVLMVALFVTVDLVTSSIVLGGLGAAAALSGLRPGALARRTAPLLAAAVGIALFNTALAPEPQGTRLLELGPVVVTQESALAGLAAALRLVGIAFSGVLAVATIDPTDLADALVQHVRASPRFVVGALAAFRLVPLFGLEWQTLGLARRARGIEADRSLVDRLRAFPGRTFGLLVAAIRRATALALAMDARGFGRAGCRTLARPRPITIADWAVLAAALALAAVATTIALAVGTWRPLIAL